MESRTWHLRVGRADELAHLIAIDDDACSLFVDLGRDVNEATAHANLKDEEEEAWRTSLEAGRVMMAVTSENEPIGFASVGFVDSEPHLQQVSVRRAWMKLGIGQALMDFAIGWANGVLWLTTYADIEWNAPYYARLGFVTIAEADCGPELRHILADERRALPAPEQRIAMRRRA